MRLTLRLECVSGLRQCLSLGAVLSLVMLLGVYSSQAQPTPSSSLKGDINGDGLIGMSDAILGLQVMSSMNPPGVRGDYVTSRVDVNNDNQFGLPDFIYVLQKIAGRNDAPVVDIGPDRISSKGSIVKLSAHRSYDTDGDPLTYSWSLISKPPASTTRLSDNTAMAPSFTPDMEGAYLLSCIVNDGHVDSELATITITATKDEFVTISPQGGQYHLANGISVDVPAGAVSAETPISMRFIDYETAASIVENTGLTDKKLIVAFNAEPSGLNFAVPISVKLPAGVTGGGGIAYQWSLDMEKETCTPVLTDLKWDPNQHEIEMFVISFSKKAAAEIRKAQDAYAKAYCRQIGECKCGAIRVQESSRDDIYDSGGCQISEISGSINYLSCQGEPVENWSFREITDGCEPELKISRIEPIACGIPVEIEAQLTIKDLPLEGQLVQFSVPAPGKVTPEVTQTSSSGEAHAQLSADIKEGKVTLTVTADAVWVLEYITADGQAFAAKEREKHLKQDVDIEVRQLPTTGEIIYTLTWKATTSDTGGILFPCSGQHSDNAEWSGKIVVKGDRSEVLSSDINGSYQGVAAGSCPDCSYFQNTWHMTMTSENASWWLGQWSSSLTSRFNEYVDENGSHMSDPFLSSPSPQMWLVEVIEGCHPQYWEGNYELPAEYFLSPGDLDADMADHCGLPFSKKWTITNWRDPLSPDTQTSGTLTWDVEIVKGPLVSP